MPNIKLLIEKLEANHLLSKGELPMSCWEQMAKTIDAGEEKKKKEELYQKTFHELAEKLSEIRNKETQDEAED